jgi:hypothetical protein
VVDKPVEVEPPGEATTQSISSPVSWLMPEILQGASWNFFRTGEPEGLRSPAPRDAPVSGTQCKHHPCRRDCLQPWSHALQGPIPFFPAKPFVKLEWLVAALLLTARRRDNLPFLACLDKRALGGRSRSRKQAEASRLASCTPRPKPSETRHESSLHEGP